MEGDMESSQGVLARRSVRLVLVLLVAVLLSLFALLRLEGSGSSPVRPLTNISSNRPASGSPTIQNSGTSTTTMASQRECNDNDNKGEGGPNDNDTASGECGISGG